MYKPNKNFSKLPETPDEPNDLLIEDESLDKLPEDDNNGLRFIYDPFDNDSGNEEVVIDYDSQKSIDGSIKENEYLEEESCFYINGNLEQEIEKLNMLPLKAQQTLGDSSNGFDDTILEF